jgi:hypothetical protein
MLLYRARADAQLACDFFIAAALHQQIQNLLISGCDLYFFEYDHLLFSSRGLWGMYDPRQVIRQNFARSKKSAKPFKDGT